MKNLIIIPILFLAVCVFGQKKMSKIKTTALQEVTNIQDARHNMCQMLWDYSETALLESKSAALLIGELQSAGFSVEKNVAGMPTAFVATWGSGSPKIGILAEYDALPGVGNQAVPDRIKREDGITGGHGCGHNLFGAASVSASIATKNIMESEKLEGTIVLFGTPAEETVVGKVYMAKAGIFDGMDAVLDWHPGLETHARYKKGLAMNNFEVEFFGQAAHGAADPWNGRSALDAVEMMNYGVNLMREHIQPSTRIHYVIPNGGEAPNVVPEYAKVWYYVRDTVRGNVEKYYQRILDIAEGAALGTATTHKVSLITGVHEYNINAPIMFNLQENLRIVGPPQFSEEEQTWGKQLQKSAGKEPKGFDATLSEVPENWEKIPTTGGSTDVAEVSFIAPTAGFRVASSPKDVPWHSWVTTASHGTSAGFKAADVAAKVLTLSAVDLLTNEKLLSDAKAYFMQKTGGKTYESPLPKEQEVKLPDMK